MPPLRRSTRPPQGAAAGLSLDGAASGRYAGGRRPLWERGAPVTEAQWLASWNGPAMIAALAGKGSERLWRLFAVACAGRYEEEVRDARSRSALEVAVRFA